MRVTASRPPSAAARAYGLLAGRGVLESAKAAVMAVARGSTGATAAKAKEAVFKANGLITMIS